MLALQGAISPRVPAGLVTQCGADRRGSAPRFVARIRLRLRRRAARPAAMLRRVRGKPITAALPAAAVV
jgi:hypothetical protein